MKTTGLYGAILRRVLKLSFRFWQRLGFHITPNHFYQPIPDTRTLKDDLWQKESELVGIDINEKGQIELLSLFSSRFKEEYDRFPRSKTSVPYQYYVNNGLFDSVDGEILHCMIRHFRPNRIFEIGSGYSTYLSAQAVLRNEEDDGHKCKLIAFEPYPNDVLKAGFPGLHQLATANIQDIPLQRFGELEENDILFIDSSHVLRIGGDVQYEYLEILPRLNKGVIVHVHDIFLPAEYPKDWVLEDCRFWTEQYLLQAFLTFNDSFEVLWAGNYMRSKHPAKLEAAFSSYRSEERWPGSFWIRKRR
ncbi:MAG: class I SAM-dependent methyltransferase [Methanomassiliicoccales archaeon]|nr:MAG: class I SAM-dependent methyltransferase [Methanomassiliicoccales archaeon]